MMRHQLSEQAEAWAERLAAQLPPFTPAEAAEAGRFRATLDARRLEQRADAKQAAA